MRAYIIINFFTNGCCAMKAQGRTRRRRRFYCDRECTTGWV